MIQILHRAWRGVGKAMISFLINTSNNKDYHKTWYKMILLLFIHSPYSSDGENRDVRGKRQSNPNPITKSSDEKRSVYCKFMELMNRKSKSGMLDGLQC